jgi:dTDP-glucose 4,6-dehydratase
MRLLITGGCGFIGSAVCRHAVEKLGWTVINVDCMTYAASEGSTAGLVDSSNYIHECVDIVDRTEMDLIFTRYRPTAAIHLAAESHVDRSIDGPMAFVRTNVNGTASLLDAAKSFLAAQSDKEQLKFRFLHVSTDEVFGSLDHDSARFTEKSPYDPSSPYSATKASSDHLVRAYGRTYRLPVLLTNCSNNYGPFHFPEKLIPLTIIKALRGEVLPVYGNGMNVRDWLYVEDHAAALCLVLQKGAVGESYNIGGDEERTNLQVVEAICDLLDVKAPKSGPARRDLIRFVEDRPGHDLRYAIDASKIKQKLGWKPSVSFVDGLERTVDWFLTNEDWWQDILDRGNYDGGRLGATSQRVDAV